MNGILTQRIQQALAGPERSVSLAPVLKKLDRDAAQLADMRDTLARAVRGYECGVCGDTAEFTEAGTLDDYAALCIWLGRHERCDEVKALRSRGARESARAIVQGLGV